MSAVAPAARVKWRRFSMMQTFSLKIYDCHACRYNLRWLVRLAVSTTAALRSTHAAPVNTQGVGPLLGERNIHLGCYTLRKIWKFDSCVSTHTQGFPSFIFFFHQNPMRKFPLLFAPILLSSVLVACGGGGGGSDSPSSGASASDINTLYPVMVAGTPPGASQAARNAATALGKGINFGNMLEAPTEGAWGLSATDEFINLFGAAPLKSKAVRLPVRWSNHASTDAAATIDPVFMARVKGIVDKLIANGVTVSLDMHHYRQLDGDALDAGETAVDSSVLHLRFLSMWRQIAKTFASYDKTKLVFELYNEPHGNLTASAWNTLASRALRVVRESDSNNQTRIVMLGPVSWNSPTALSSLQLPADANLIVTVHHYEPFNFTHQGANWVSGVPAAGSVHCCDASQLTTIRSGLDLAQSAAQSMNYPVVVGEFGAYSGASDADRVNYLTAMRDEMASRNLPWMYWELASGFGLYDPAAHAWRTNLTNVLFP